MMYRHLFILDNEAEEERKAFCSLLIEIWPGVDEARLADGVRIGYHGRLGIYLNIDYYPACCGLFILSDPRWNFEFYSSPVNAIVNRPYLPQHYTPYAGDTIAAKTQQQHVASYTYTTTQALIAGITDQLTRHIGHKGGYLISDWSKNGVLFKFCDKFLDRKVFRMERWGSFFNGNTAKKLTTWFARSNRNSVLAYDTGYTDESNVDVFTAPKVEEAISGHSVQTEKQW